MKFFAYLLLINGHAPRGLTMNLLISDFIP